MKLVFYSVGLVLASMIVKYNKVYLISNIPPKNVRDKDDHHLEISPVLSTLHNGSNWLTGSNGYNLSESANINVLSSNKIKTQLCYDFRLMWDSSLGNTTVCSINLITYYVALLIM